MTHHVGLPPTFTTTWRHHVAGLTVQAATRVKVACINWGYPDAPHALMYVVNGSGEMVGESYYGTWPEALAKANQFAHYIRSVQAAAR